MHHLNLLGLTFWLLVSVFLPLDQAQASNVAIAEDEPVVHFRFDASLANSGSLGDDITVKQEGKVELGQAGPRPKLYPDFSARNKALKLNGGYLRIADPGEASPLDFTNGDALTLEAWVNPEMSGNGYFYIIGKGRTNHDGFVKENQNWSLRLDGKGGEFKLSFLFRDHRNGGDEHFHRWTSAKTFATRTDWHHVAVAYRFGDPKSIVGYIDGESTKGNWDMGGTTKLPPVVDNDEVWVGSSLGGNHGSSFIGNIDEVAIHRRIVPANRLKARYHFEVPVWLVDADKLPDDSLRVEILEKVGSDWLFVPNEPTLTYSEPVFAFPKLPVKYSAKGIRVDRSNPFLLRAAGRVRLAEGEHRLLLRARTGTRVRMDGKLIAETKFAIRNASGHESVPELPEPLGQGVRQLRPGLYEQQMVVESPGAEHVFTLEAFVGDSSGLRMETGELSVSILSDGKKYSLLSPKHHVPLTDEGWENYAEERSMAMDRRNAATRRAVSSEEAEYWQWRHKVARKQLAKLEPLGGKCVDDFVDRKLRMAKLKPFDQVDDWTFLRRVSLDVVGVPPTPEQIKTFFADSSPKRRSKFINRILAEDGWADHWVGYWQDVLAENPNILKPSLNNTGPFRFWIHESFADNKPFDRFVTELVMMEGSKYYGAPAGFEMAAENDVPMAAKAQIVAQAFLGLEMKCARCHDAPYHDFRQEQLFSLAAMLKRSPQNVPASSSIPASANITLGRLVNVTLKPGSNVAPAWPFPELMDGALHDEVVRKAGDTREQLAALLTDPRNQRFAQVVANRLWKRYMGWGFVEPVDDWDHAEASHPELLDFLGRVFVLSGYDLKHLARLILNSQAYQRELLPNAIESEPAEPEERLFAGQVRRRLSAEQVVDSLFAISGKAMGAEELTMDVDGRRPASTFLNLGVPHRAWQLTSLSNERDRPALSIPKAQSVVDVLSVFGWRDSRQDAQTKRDHESNVLQPATVANGVLVKRFSQLSDNSAFTEVAVNAVSPDDLVEILFERVYTREPSAVERQVFVELLSTGFAKRVVPGAKVTKRVKSNHAVSWSNHLSPEATRIKMEMERLTRAGDPPTERLQVEWREKMEDTLWAMANSPEFIFVP